MDFTDGSVTTRFQNSGGFFIGTESNHNVSIKTGGTGVKMTVTAAGNVGIGNTAPAEKFTIGSAASKGDIGFHIGGHRLITFGYMTTNSSETTYAGFPAEIRHDPTNGLLRFGVDGTTRSVGDTSSVSTALTIKTGGNVGVGTQTPDQKLDVNGNIGINGLEICLLYTSPSPRDS